MEYISTRNTKKTFSFRDVFLNSLASDGGLYVPKNIPLYSNKNLENLRNLSYQDLAVKIVSDFCVGEFDKTEIKDLIKGIKPNRDDFDNDITPSPTVSTSVPKSGNTIRPQTN